MSSGTFDIYQGPTGPTAVTNDVQRQILEALAKEDLQLPDLVRLTGRSKPTLSGNHMKELLNRELITELPHPSDNRRKIYRLNARPLGSSEVPVDELRNAVKAYARTVSAGGAPLDLVFRVLASAPPKTPAGALSTQAETLGRMVGGRIGGTDPRSFAVAFAQFVENEGLAQHLQLDFEGLSFRCRPGRAVSDVDAGRMGALLAGFAIGAAAANGLDGVAFRAKRDGDAFVLSPP